MFLELDDPQVWQDKPQHVVLEGVVGSRAYGLETEHSDTDRLGVFVEPTLEFLGLDAPLESARNPQHDEQLHELRKFLALGLKCNPTILELLYLEDYETVDEVGLGLIGLRDKLLWADRVRGAYLGYARDEVDRLRHGAGERAGKAARTAARIARQGFQLWSTGALQVREEAPGWYHDLADRAAGGDIAPVEAVVQRYTELFDTTPSVLPQQPDRDAVNAWLKQVRRRML